VKSRWDIDVEREEVNPVVPLEGRRHALGRGPGRRDAVTVRDVTRAAAVTVLAIASFAGATSCGGASRSLLQVNVSGDQLYTDVTLRLSVDAAAGQSYHGSYTGVSLDTTVPFQAGVYVAAGGGTLRVSAVVDDGRCIVGRAAEIEVPAAQGSVIGPATLLVQHAMGCDPIPDGGATGTGGAGAGGGGSPDGSGGAPGAGGGGGVPGTGGALVSGVGGGGGVPGTGGGGVPGTGGIGATGAGGGGLGGNLITNGDFSLGDALWHVDNWSTPTTVSYAVKDGQFCATLNPGASITLGWPSDTSASIMLASGALYYFGYRASWSGASTAGLILQAKAGTAAFSTMSDQLTSTPQLFQHSFYGDGEPPTGVAFNVTYNGSTPGDLCVDDVTLILVSPAKPGTGGAPGVGGRAGTGGKPGTGGAGGTGPSGNLITNGDFSLGDTLWQVQVYTPSGSVTSAVVNGAMCITLNPAMGGASMTLGWPSDTSFNIPIIAGSLHYFGYRVSSTVPSSAGGLSFNAKAGAGQNFSISTDALTTTAQLFQHNFTATYGEAATGVAFNISYGGAGTATVCVDDVVLMRLN
jgi:hypothetical protein